MPTGCGTAPTTPCAPATASQIVTMTPGPHGGQHRAGPQRCQFCPFGWLGCPGFLLGSLGAADVRTLDGSGGIGWLGLVPGRYHTGSPPTLAWPRPAGSENHSSLGAFIVSSALCMNACQAGAAVWMASAPYVISE